MLMLNIFDHRQVIPGRRPQWPPLDEGVAQRYRGRPTADADRDQDHEVSAERKCYYRYLVEVYNSAKLSADYSVRVNVKK